MTLGWNVFVISEPHLQQSPLGGRRQEEVQEQVLSTKGIK